MMADGMTEAAMALIYCLGSFGAVGGLGWMSTRRKERRDLSKLVRTLTVAVAMVLLLRLTMGDVELALGLASSIGLTAGVNKFWSMVENEMGYRKAKRSTT